MKKAIKLLQQGNVVAFPTETVFGLGADCTLDHAVQKIFDTKNRPAINPLIIHVHDINQAEKYGVFNTHAHCLVQKFWPGPLTVVVPLLNKDLVSDKVTAGLDTIAIRCPSHPTARQLLKLYPNPLAAPSANISGYISPTTPQHVRNEFGDSLYIVEGEQSAGGLESTIIDCSTDIPAILRPGHITKTQVKNILGCEVKEETTTKVIKAPGQLERHYAPNLRVRLNVTQVHSTECLLNFGLNDLKADLMLNLSPIMNLNEAAYNLYDYLRILDHEGKKRDYQGIAIAPIPMEGVGIAINERLNRAAKR